MDIVIAFINLSAMGVLFLAWKTRYRFLSGLALILACAAWILWTGRHGPEYATVYWFMTLTVFAWMTTFLNRDFKVVQAQAKPRRRTAKIGRSQLGRAFGQVMLAGPLAGLAGLLPWVLWAIEAPGVPANRIVAAVFLFILSWTLLTFWVLASSRPWKPILLIAGLIGLSGALLKIEVHG